MTPVCQAAESTPAELVVHDGESDGRHPGRVGAPVANFPERRFLRKHDGVPPGSTTDSSLAGSASAKPTSVHPYVRAMSATTLPYPSLHCGYA